MPGLPPVRVPAWTGQLGLEPEPEMYVGHLVLVFREVRRVLRRDGMLWLNLGDSYAGSWGNYGAREGKQRDRIAERWHRPAYEDPRHGWDGLPPTARPSVGLKEKDLVGVPWRAAFALQGDGWWLRSDIIWSKTNPLPESVKDRPTKAHEYVFLLAKSPRYFYDAEAVKEPDSGPQGGRQRAAFRGTFDYVGRDYKHHHVSQGGNRGLETTAYTGTRNKRSVWEINTEPFLGAHFAAFPRKLAEICILAGTSPKACPACGAPWERVVEKGEPVLGAWSAKGAGQYNIGIRGMRRAGLEDGSTLKHVVPTKTVGWRPGCRCPGNDGSARCVVLDPFGGAGTTTLAAISLGRDSVYIDLKREYAEMALERCGLREGAQVRLFCPEEWTLEEVSSESGFLKQAKEGAGE